MTKYVKQKLVNTLLQKIGDTQTPDTTAVIVLDIDSNGDVLHAKGTTVPTDAETGFAKGCLFIDTDVGTGISGLYENTGTNTACVFAVAGSVLPAGAIGETELATDAVTAAKIATGAVASDEVLDGTVAPVDVTAALKTDLVTVGLKGTVAEFGFPFNVMVNTEQVAALCKTYDLSAVEYQDVATSIAGAAYAANYQLFPDTPAEDDAAYFGGAAAFGIINIDVEATVATYGADSLTWEYWNGSAWAALTIIYDETDTTAQDGLRSFQQDGQIIFSAPTDWASTTVDSQAGFWVRARCSATVNITQVPLFDSVEHGLASSPTASEMPAAGVIGRSRLSWTTPSASNADTVIILCNLTKGTASALTTLTKALVAHEVANFALTCDAGDQVAIYVTQEDGTTEFANGIMEMNVVKS